MAYDDGEGIAGSVDPGFFVPHRAAPVGGHQPVASGMASPIAVAHVRLDAPGDPSFSRGREDHSPKTPLSRMKDVRIV